MTNNNQVTWPQVAEEIALGTVRAAQDDVGEGWRHAMNDALECGFRAHPSMSEPPGEKIPADEAARRLAVLHVLIDRGWEMAEAERADRHAKFGTV